MTFAPMPRAIFAALVPTMPPPMMQTLPGGNAGDSAEQDAAAAVFLLKIGCADLDAHAAGDLAHRGQQRKGAGRSRTVS